MKSRAWALVAGALAGVYWALYKRPLPRTSGRLAFPALEGEATVLRDSRGIPRLCVGSWADAWRCLGWVHAQDRPFQLDLQRRLCRGELSEILGRRALPADRFLRRLGLAASAAREWEQCPPSERAMLSAYAEGINAGWQASPLATEFALFGTRPRRWEARDAYLWVKALGHDLGCNWESELLRSLLLAENLDGRVLECWSLQTGPGMPRTDGSRTQDLTRALLAEYDAARAVLPPGLSFGGPLGGSNAWAVAGMRSEDGAPLLACDPHLGMKVPDYWYQVAIEVEDFALLGASMPGLPGVILGQNGPLAWGVTNAYIDVQDLFLEEVDWQRRSVRGPAGPEPLQERSESIPVRGGGPESLQLFHTARGPVVQHDEGPLALSLAWSGREPGRFFSALAGLNRARSVAEAREALQDWHLPVLNFVLADRSGNIAQQAVGRVPHRPLPSGLVVVPAWEPRTVWRRMRTFEEMPHRLNPACGYVISANHNLPQSEQDFLSWDFNPGYRAERIEELLLQRERHNPDSFGEIQCDETSTVARRLLSRVADLRAGSAAEEEALLALQGWDGRMAADSVAATIYSSWLHVLSEQLAHASLPPAVLPWLLAERSFHPLNGHPSFANRFQGRMVEACLADDPLWLRAGHPWAEVLQTAFREAVQRLRGRLGPRVSTWTWGRLHQVELRHSLRLPGWNLGKISLGGDSETPNQTAVVARDGLPGPVALGATWRFVTSLASPQQAMTAHCPGQSGHPGSAHYRDGLRDWVAGLYHRHWLDEVRSELRLSP